MEIKKPMVIFDIANNHMGKKEHGIRIVEEFAKAVADYRERFDFVVKMQYRHLDTFIHPDYKDRMDIKYVKRFSETRLSPSDLKQIKDAISANGFISMCTPFDEASLDLILEHKFDYVKIASCSFTDWPLLEYVVGNTDKPMVLSTAGASIEEIDRVVSFLSHRDRDFALMHCIAEYPTQADRLFLNQLDFLMSRYPNIPIGFSTHEDPENMLAGPLAIAKGAVLLERHIGVKTKEFGLNAYSSTPDIVRKWLDSLSLAMDMIGDARLKHSRYKASDTEIKTLRSLRRGIFAKVDMKKGEVASQDNVFFAIPSQEGQFTANDFSKYARIAVLKDVKAREPINTNNASIKNVQDSVLAIVKDISDFVAKAGVVIPSGVELEISHHYGLDRFYEYGMAMITVVNRDYCKKVLVLLPGQRHPEQYHKQKEETFFVVFGEVEVALDGKKAVCRPGEVITIAPGVRHMMYSKDGCIIEEISTTHYKDDSFYTDEKINGNKSRKTIVAFWQDLG